MPMSNEELASYLFGKATEAEIIADTFDGSNPIRADILRNAAKIYDAAAARLRAIDGLVKADRDELEAIVRARADNHTVIIEGQETTPRGAAIWWCEKHPEVK